MAHRSRFAIVLAASLAAALLFSTPSASQAPSSASAAASPAATGSPDPALQAAVDRLVKTIRGYGGKVGVSIVDVGSGRVLSSSADHEPLNPASNMKVLTAAAALWQLSSSHRFRTGLYGKRSSGAVRDLVLRGGGDPSLPTGDLRQLAAELRASGVTRVDGDVLVDASCFDNASLPPGFDQQPNEWAYFRAPVSGVSLDRNTVTMKVYPTSDGDRAAVAFEPPGCVDVVGTIKTERKGGANDVALTLGPNGPRLTARVGGAIAAGDDRVVITKRLDDPSLCAGFALKAILAELGVSVSGGVKAGGEGQHDALAIHRSAPLGELLSALGKDSDNFYAETIFKSLASGSKRRGLSSADGTTILERQLARIGAPQDGNVFRNGSGLFDTNRVSPATLTAVLTAAWQDPTVRPEFASQLAIGGIDGTLHGRFRGTRSRRMVRAKTGTLNSVTALSGYVLAPLGKGPVAFSILVNGVAGKVSGARAAIDRCVEAIVKRIGEGASSEGD